MEWQAVGIALTIIGGLYGAAQLVVGSYFKKAKEFEDYKEQHVNQAIEELKEVTKLHSEKLDQQSRDNRELERKLDISIARYSQYQDAQEAVIDSFRSFSEASNQRILSLEGTVVSLGKDVYMLKSKGSKN